MVNKYTYIRYFLDDISKHANLNELEKHFNIPHQTIKRQLSDLISDKIIIEDKKERFIFYKLNVSNSLVFDYLSIAEKIRLSEFLKKALFLNLYKTLSQYFEVSNILIFGSAVNQKSFDDIDILIFSEEKQILGDIKKFEETYSKKIHPIITTEISPVLKTEVIKKHIIFNNHDFFIKYLYRS